MGQAFDRDGNVLGEAYGETKREVFDKLSAQFEKAHELRIKSLGDTPRDPLPERMLQFFTYDHLPEALRTVSKPFCDLAQQIVATLPQDPERTVALRKLLEAKDCAVRAKLSAQA